MRYLTDRKRVEGLGTAHSGTHHFWEQRISAIALLVLAPFFVIAFGRALGAGYDEARAIFAEPFNAIVAIAFFTTGFLHLFLGLQVVIEDYVHGRLGLILIISARLLCALGALVGIYAVILIALGS